MSDWYAVWCKDLKPPDWMRDSVTGGIVAFPSKRSAMSAAAKNYGFDTYTQAKEADWCEVRPLGDRL